MSQGPWQLRPPHAFVERGPLRATLRLTRPDRGLFDVRVQETLLADSRLLGIAIPAAIVHGECSPADCHVRGADLAVSYPATAAWPIEIDAVWRICEPDAACPWIAAVELIVSVRTALLDSRPELAVESALGVTEGLRLADRITPRYEPLELGSDRLPRAWQSEPGCVLLRLRHEQFSYLEMVHPADFHGDRIAGEPGPGRLVRTSHRLFPDPLEKGVLLRARVRGVFLPRDADLAVAADSYRALASSEPPLGTF